MSSRFSLIIPVYNESQVILETLSIVTSVFTSRLSIPWQIIVADNASKDGTADIVEAAHIPSVRVIRLKEKGRARAVRAGWEEAGGGIVAFTDVDLSVSPEEIISAVELIVSGSCEIVYGTRFHSGSRVARSFLRNLSSQIFLILARMILGLKASDSQCPLKMTNERTRAIMLATKDPTWFNDIEFMILAERLGVSMKALPVNWREDRYPERKTKLKLVRDGRDAVMAMFKIRFRLKTQLGALSNLSKKK